MKHPHSSRWRLASRALGNAALLTTASALILGARPALTATNPALLQDFPFQGACVSARFPAGNVAMKGVAIRLGNDASVLFDTDLLRMAAGWKGRFITTFGVAFDGNHGGHPAIDGDQIFGTPKLPGWAGADGDFKDTRAEPFGPVSPDFARWDGLHLNGQEVVLAYTVRGTSILEQPSSIARDGQFGFVRTFKLGPVLEPLTMMVCEVPDATGAIKDAFARLNGADGSVTTVGTVGLPVGAKLEVAGNRIVLRLAPDSAPATFKLVIWRGPTAELGKFPALLEGKPSIADVTRGGPTRWPQEVITKGTLATSKTPDGAYVTDSLTPPLENPWKRRVRFSGLDFFKDGTRAALCTWDGDIWIVSGIDAKLGSLKWKRFASGMYETIGLKIVDDTIYTSGRDQITRYHDRNQDGEVDYYENFCNLYTSTEGFHEFVFDLQTDREGHFYFAKAGPVRPGGGDFETISASAGTLMKVSKDGRKLEVYATGFRAPNGIAVGPDGQVTTGDNQGTWVPTCPLNWVKPGGFYGVEQLAHHNPIPEFKPPMMWFAYREFDNSGGGQAWVTTDKWGPFQGDLLHASYGKCAVYLIAPQAVGDLMQGAAIKFPLKLSSSAMRMKFNPGDGQLYVAGMQGWQTDAAKLSGLDRIRYTGKPVYLLEGVLTDTVGVHLTFTQPLDEKEAADTQNYSGKRWNYRRTSAYGSDDYSVADPNKKGRDTLNITAARLSADGKTVTLSIEDLRPANVQLIKFSLKAKDGTPIDSETQQTINVIPKG